LSWLYSSYRQITCPTFLWFGRWASWM
jgi:hypothetical protein